MASISDKKGNIFDIQWNIDGEVIYDQSAVNVTSGEFEVTVRTNDGCELTKPFIVNTEIFVYNGVTANGDGENDVFIIDCIDEFKNNIVKIYNRAGALVYEMEGYNNQDKAFDGVGNRGVYPAGSQVPDGTYYYVVDKRDGSKAVSGYLELIR